MNSNPALHQLQLLRASTQPELFERSLSACANNLVHIQNLSFANIGDPVPGTTIGPYTWFTATVDGRHEVSGFVWVFPFVLRCSDPHYYAQVCPYCVPTLIAVLLEQAGMTVTEYAAHIGVIIPEPEYLDFDEDYDYWAGYPSTLLPQSLTEVVPEPEIPLSFDDEAIEADPVRSYLDSLNYQQLRDFIEHARLQIGEFRRFCQQQTAVATGTDKEVEAIIKDQLDELFGPTGWSYINPQLNSAQLCQAITSVLDLCDSLMAASRPKAVHRQLRRLVEKLARMQAENWRMRDDLEPLLQRAMPMYATVAVAAKVRPVNLAKWLLRVLKETHARSSFGVGPFVPAFTDQAVAEFTQGAIRALTDLSVSDEAIFTLWDEAAVLAIAWGNVEQMAETMMEYGLKRRAMDLLDQAGSREMARKTFLTIVEDIREDSDLALPPEDALAKFLDFDLKPEAKHYFSRAASLIHDIQSQVFLQAAYTAAGEKLDVAALSINKLNLRLALWQAIESGEEQEIHELVKWTKKQEKLYMTTGSESLNAYLAVVAPGEAIDLLLDKAKQAITERADRHHYGQAADHAQAAVAVACLYTGEKREELLDFVYTKIEHLLSPYRNRSALLRAFKERVPARAALSTHDS